jgi:hypothetical protein
VTNPLLHFRSSVTFGSVRLGLVTLRFITLRSVMFLFYFPFVTFCYVRLCMVRFGFISFSYFTFISVTFLFFFPFLMFYVRLCMVRFCLIMFGSVSVRYITSTAPTGTLRYFLYPHIRHTPTQSFSLTYISHRRPSYPFVLFIRCDMRATSGYIFYLTTIIRKEFLFVFSFLCDQQQALWSPLHGFDPNQSTCQKIEELITIHKI